MQLPVLVAIIHEQFVVRMYFALGPNFQTHVFASMVFDNRIRQYGIGWSLSGCNSFAVYGAIGSYGIVHETKHSAF